MELKLEAFYWKFLIKNPRNTTWNFSRYLMRLHPPIGFYATAATDVACMFMVLRGRLSRITVL